MSDPLWHHQDLYLNVLAGWKLKKELNITNIFSLHHTYIVSNKLSYASETNPYAVRNALDRNLSVPKPKTELFKKSFAYSAPFLWNCLPTSVRKSNNTNVFKTNIKNYIFDSSSHQGSIWFIFFLESHF